RCFRSRPVGEEVDKAVILPAVGCGDLPATCIECPAIALRLIKAESARPGLILGKVCARLQSPGARRRIENLKRAISAARYPLERRAAGTEIEGLDPAWWIRPSELREQLAAIAVARLRVEKALQQACTFARHHVRVVDDIEHGRAQVVA